MREEVFKNGVLVHAEALPPPAAADYAAAIQLHLDAMAMARGYGDGVALASYVNSSVSHWASEAAAFVAWRDAVWVAAYAVLAAVQSGQREPPEIASLLAELPPIAWPGS